MKFDYIVLSSEERSGLDTEIRFAVASAVVDGRELIALALTGCEDDEQKKRFTSSVKRILSVLKREGRISFYIDGEALDRGSTEAEFLQNKYSSYLTARKECNSLIYVKI